MAIEDPSVIQVVSLLQFLRARRDQNNGSHDSSSTEGPVTPRAVRFDGDHAEEHDHTPRSRHGVRRRTNSFGKKELHEHLSTPPSTPSKGSKKGGSRKYRRWESLMSLIKNLEITEDDVAPSHSSSSVFATLLADPAHLQSWYRFLEMSEEKQQLLLRSTNGMTDRDHSKPAREVTALDCYKRIDRNSRRILRKSNVPAGLLARLESDVAAFLASPSSDSEWVPVADEQDEWDVVQAVTDCSEEQLCEQMQDAQLSELSSDILIWSLPDSYARCIAHAVCQYYGLASHSEDIGAARIIRVLKRDTSRLPPVSLASYLELC